MFCTKCGSQNADGAAFCVNCGNSLQNSGAAQRPQTAYGPQGYYPPQTVPYTNYPIKAQTNRKALIIGLIIAGVVLVAGIVLLIVLLPGNASGNSVLGMWYEESGYGGTLNFNSNGTVDMGVMGMPFTVDYTFDTKTGTGEINIYGSTTSMTLSGGVLSIAGTTYTRNVVEQQELDLSDYGLSDSDLSDYGF